MSNESIRQSFSKQPIPRQSDDLSESLSASVTAAIRNNSDSRKPEKEEKQQKSLFATELKKIRQNRKTCASSTMQPSAIGNEHPHSFADANTHCFDDSIIAKAQDCGVVWNAFLTSINGLVTANVVVVSFKEPETGDKLSSGMAQKGTIGLLMDEADMPFCSDGLIPDLIINPHCFPGRMTVNQILSCWAATASVLSGSNEADGTPFVCDIRNDFKSVENVLLENGFNKDGKRFMYDGATGRRIKTEVFIGPTFYHRLNHLVQNKLHARAHGSVTMTTRQPNCGRSKNGGLRLGEMEVTCIMVHGCFSFILERLFYESDAFSVAICKTCGCFSNDDNICNLCQGSHVFKVKMPYAMKQLYHELMASGIKIQFELK
jgi:DNA-directed RNA polymerase II subunit RPB2